MIDNLLDDFKIGSCEKGIKAIIIEISDKIAIGINNFLGHFTIIEITENIIETICLVFAPLVIVEIFKLFKINTIKGEWF